MPALTVKYRPKRVAQLAGQPAVLAKVGKLRKSGLSGRAYWISGKSGTGKTSLARAIAFEIADDFFIDERDAGSLTVADVREIERTWRSSGWGKGGRAYIINEAHGLRRDTLRALLVLLENDNIPRHVVFAFTTTNEGQALFDDAQIDSSPLLSRCTVLSLASRGIAPVFAALVRRIARREGLDGRPETEYLKLANKCKGNCRAMLQAVEAGEMLAE